MKDAVTARNAFAAAHSAYAMSLKNTGAALSDYAHGEVQNPQLPTQTNSNNPPHYETLPPPPPPLPNFPAAPLQRAATMPELKLPKPDSTPSDTIEEENEDEISDDEMGSSSLRHRSSRRSGGGSRSAKLEVEDDSPPPPPPRVDTPPPPPRREEPPSMPPETNNATWEFFFPSVENMPGTTLSEVEEVRVHEQKVFEERPKRVDETPVVVENPVEPAPAPPPPGAVVGPKNPKKVKQGSSSVTAGPGAGVMEVKRAGGKNLLQIFIELDDHFLKASESAHEVSKMLEATRLHYHSNFADNRGHIDHSARVMRAITWNRSFKGLPNADDGKDDFDSEEHETHATVLDKMLAWEKKLYDEVKAGEIMRFEYQKKVAMLNKQKKRGTNAEALEKTKAAVSHLNTRYIVDMQSMDSTVSEINRLRDDQLYPKLVALVDGMATMWGTMLEHHKSQSKTAMALKSLDISQSPKETSEHHHKRTIQLWIVVQEWHSQFDKLVTNQKNYITALKKWLRLNLIPIESNLKEKVSSPPRPQNPPIQALLQAWNDHLEKLPDELAKTSISNFAAIIETIMQHQQDEMRLKAKCEETAKELERKTRQFNDWHSKYMQKRIPDENDREHPGDDPHDEVVIERKLVVETLSNRLKDEEETYQKECVLVRDKSLASLKNHLPELFRALSEFSYACSDMYSRLRSISRSQKPAGN